MYFVCLMYFFPIIFLYQIKEDVRNFLSMIHPRICDFSYL